MNVMQGNKTKLQVKSFPAEGMEELEFEEAASSLHDLVDEYKQSQFSRSETTFKGSESSIKEEE